MSGARLTSALGLTLLLVGAPTSGLAQPAPGELLRPQGCVLDRAGVLSARTVEDIEAECRRVAAAGHELAVVVVRAADSRGPAQYALDLFNAWRLGGPDDSDGVLLFAAIDDRAAEITLGDDLDTAANTARSDRVMAEVIVPAFRRGAPDAAMREGARYVAANLFSAGPGPLVHPQRALAQAANTAERPAPALPRPDAPAQSRSHEPSGLLERVAGFFDGPVLWITLGVLGVLLFVGVRRFLRHRRRRCDECGSPMVRLGEVEDDAHLSSAQRKEEQIGSVDYDVWACQSCDRLIERRYSAWFSGYRTCSSCAARTESSVSRTIQAATQHSTGLAEVTVSCAHCGRTSRHTRVIPKKPKPSDRRGGGSSSSSRRSSFGGGGGGRSSGGGSSGRW